MLVRSMRVSTGRVMGMFFDCSAINGELGCVFDGAGLLDERSGSGKNSVE
jgi:hypothetical protein